MADTVVAEAVQALSVPEERQAAQVPEAETVAAASHQVVHLEVQVVATEEAAAEAEPVDAAEAAVAAQELQADAQAERSDRNLLASVPNQMHYVEQLERSFWPPGLLKCIRNDAENSIEHTAFPLGSEESLAVLPRTQAAER